MATDIIARGIAENAQKLASQASEYAMSAEQSAQIAETAANIASVAQSSAEKTLSSIPEDYTELSNDVVGLKSDFGDYKIVTLENLSWVTGRINSSGINYNGAGYAYRTSNYYEFEAETVTIKDDNTNHKNYSLHIFAYDTNDVFISKCAYTDVGDKRIRVNKLYKYRFMYIDDTSKEMPDYTKLRIVYDYADDTVRGIDKRVSLLETVNQTVHVQRKPRVTFIDDDGHIQFYKLIKPIMETYNIPYCISYPATYLPYNADSTHMSYAQCKEIVDIGGEVLAHGMSPLTSITISEAEDDVVKTKKILEEYGFKINGYIYPSGSSNEDVREMIAKHYKFAMKTNEAQQAFRINTDCIPSYYINRCNNGGYYDAKSGNYTNIDTASIEYMKMLVDECVEKNGWLIMVSHAGYMPEGSRKAGYENVDQVQLLKDTIEYIQSLKASGTDIDIITASEGFEMFGNAAQYGDYLGVWNESKNYHNTPGCAVNKIGQWDFPTSQKIIH